MKNIMDLFYHLNSFFQPPGIGVILLYHRIADVTNDPHQLSVSKIHFKQQVRWLTENAHIVPLLTLLHNLKNNVIYPRSVSITFDDGYADNYFNAQPILHAYKVPTTFFVTAAKIGDNKPFYWDTIARVRDQGRPLTKIELMQLSRKPLVEIGSHSMSHPHLSAVSNGEQKEEISKSKRQVENMVGKTINGFSYPFGTKRDYNNKTLKIVQASGYRYACANFPGRVTTLSNPYALPRYIIRNWPKEVFMQKMKLLL